MTVIQPCDGVETEQCIKAISEYYGPVYVRLGRSAVEVVNTDSEYKFEIGKGVVLHKGDKDIIMVASE